MQIFYKKKILRYRILGKIANQVHQIMESLRLLIFSFPSIFFLIIGWFINFPGCGKQKKKEPKKVGQSAASVAGPPNNPPQTKNGPQQGTATKAPLPADAKKDATATPQKSPNPDSGKKADKNGKEKKEVRILVYFYI